MKVLNSLLNYNGPISVAGRIWNKRRAATDEGWSARHLLPVRSIPAARRKFTLLREPQVWYLLHSSASGSCRIRIDLGSIVHPTTRVSGMVPTPLVCFRQLRDPDRPWIYSSPYYESLRYGIPLVCFRQLWDPDRPWILIRRWRIRIPCQIF
jgi:hypothetical protein